MMQTFLDKIVTSGTGLWSDKVKEVKTTNYSVPFYNDPDRAYGELRVYFDTDTWNVDEDGLIYTDPAFLESIRQAFGCNDINYSEQGMQGVNFVSFDVGPEFYMMGYET